MGTLNFENGRYVVRDDEGEVVPHRDRQVAQNTTRENHMYGNVNPMLMAMMLGIGVAPVLPPPRHSQGSHPKRFTKQQWAKVKHKRKQAESSRKRNRAA